MAFPALIDGVTVVQLMAAGVGRKGGKHARAGRLSQKRLLLTELLSRSVTCTTFVGMKNRTFLSFGIATALSITLGGEINSCRL